MLDELPAVICVENRSNETILGRLRDGRNRSVLATAMDGSRTTAREPLWQTPLAAIVPGATGCVEGLPPTLERPVLNLWTTRPVHVLLNGREDNTDCRLPRPLTAGARVTYAYVPGVFGSTCRIRKDH